MSFDIKIRVDPGQSVQQIDGVTKALEKTEKAADAVSKESKETGRAFKMLDSQSKSLRASIDQFEKAIAKPSLFSTFKGGMKSIAGAMTPLNQGLQLAGKVAQFAEAGLDAYAKTSVEAANDVRALKAEIAGWRDTVLEAAGAATVALLRPIESIDKLEKRYAEMLEKFRKGGIDAFLKQRKATGFLTGDDETIFDGGKSFFNPLQAERAAEDLLKRLGLDEESAQKRKEAVDEAAREAERLSKEYAKIGLALLGPGTTPESHRAGITVEQEKEIEKANFEAAERAQTEAEKRAYDAHVEMLEAQAKADKEFFDLRDKYAEEFAQKRIEKEKQIEQAVAQGLGSLAAEIVNMAADGEMNLEKLGSSLAKLALQIAATQAGGVYGAALSSFAGGLNFGTGGSGRVPYDLPRAADGLSGRVGGAGGTDSRLFVARVTPGEYFDFRTPQQEQRRRERMPAAGPVSVTVVANNNERDVIAAGGTFGARRVLVENNRKLYGRRSR